MLYKFVVAEQTVASPLMVPGWGGAVPPPTVTASVCADDDPHALFALTLIFPPVAPATAVIEFVVELPVHPDGKVHV